MNTAYIHSRLADDPEFGELVEMFVQEMPDRISALETQTRSRDWEQLRRTAHQLKGTAGSYGFDAITPYAARLENALKEGHPEAQIRVALHDLLDLCRRVRAGAAQADEAPVSSALTPPPPAVATAVASCMGESPGTPRA